MADNAGMLEWSLVSNECEEYSELADTITMTSFAVTKDEERDCLISWPRVQNELIGDPPPVELPNPCSFSKMQVDRGSSRKAFFFYISNMFHNICLPSWLARFFPLQPVRFGNLPGHLQRILAVKSTGDCLRTKYFVLCSVRFPWDLNGLHTSRKRSLGAVSKWYWDNSVA